MREVRGEADVIDCGPGVDTALIDFHDVLADPAACEIVNRAPRAKKGEDQKESTDPAEESARRE